MSATTLRHYALTLSYLPTRTERQVVQARRTLRTSLSRRRFKQIVRTFLAR